MFPFFRNGVLFLAIATVVVGIVAVWPHPGSAPIESAVGSVPSSGFDAPLPEGVFDIPRYVRGAHQKIFVPNTTAITGADYLPFVNISTKEQLLSAMVSDTALQSIMFYIAARIPHGYCETESILYIARLLAFFWPGMRRYENPPTLTRHLGLGVWVSELVAKPALGEGYRWYTDKGRDYLNRCVSLAREIIYNETVLGIPFPG